VKKRFLVLGALLVVLAAPFAWVWTFNRPSNDREWSRDQALLPRAVIQGERVTIENVRNFNYRTAADYEPRYETRNYDLTKLDSLWFVVERFGQDPAPVIGHTFLSFGFGDEYVVISAEIRRELGETYSPIRGVLRQYELMYVVADERDVIGLRTNLRGDPVYLYPVKTSREGMRRVFVEMLERANRLAAQPEFYNTLTNNCTSNIVSHVNVIAPHTIPFSYKSLMPAYADELAYELGLIPNDLPMVTVRAAHRIDALARTAPLGPDFSMRVRKKRIARGD
jgi:hypothetical protein